MEIYVLKNKKGLYFKITEGCAKLEKDIKNASFFATKELAKMQVRLITNMYFELEPIKVNYGVDMGRTVTISIVGTL